MDATGIAAVFVIFFAATIAVGFVHGLFAGKALSCVDITDFFFTHGLKTEVLLAIAADLFQALYYMKHLQQQ
jgi:hypothetical protein